MMSVPDAAATPALEPVPEGLLEAGLYRTQAEGFEHGLVVLAMGEPYWLIRDERGYRLLVEAPVFETVRRQLAYFDRESAGWPPRPVGIAAPAMQTAEFVTPLLWSLAIIGVFWAQVRWPGLVAEACLDVRAVFQRGEGWRPATALFLHADVGHLVSNGVSGILVFSAVLSTFGRRLGWMLLGAAAVAGNLMVAGLYYPTDYRSLGASTAIFGGFGLLTGRAMRTAGHGSERQPTRMRLGRLAVGLTILGLYGAGAGGGRVDVLAHLCGFLAGAVLGLVASPGSRTDSTRDHRGS